MQANYTSITQNVVDYGTNLTNLFWNAQLMTDLVTSFNNSISAHRPIFFWQRVHHQLH